MEVKAHVPHRIRWCDYHDAIMSLLTPLAWLVPEGPVAGMRQSLCACRMIGICAYTAAAG